MIVLGRFVFLSRCPEDRTSLGLMDDATFAAFKNTLREEKANLPSVASFLISAFFAFSFDVTVLVD
jgi:hypothetical protein